MAISRSLRNLLRVRDMQEEQQKGLLGAAMAELHAIEAALAAARDRKRNARAAMGNACAKEDANEWRAFELESDMQARRETLLSQYRENTRQRVSEARELYLGKRTERRQAEALVEAAQSREARDAEVRQQRDLDQWYAARPAAAASDEE